MNFTSGAANRGLRTAASSGPTPPFPQGPTFAFTDFSPAFHQLDSGQDFSMEFVFCFVDANGFCE